MDGVTGIGVAALLLWLFSSKKGSAKILETANNGTRVKYRLQYGNAFVESWIFQGDKAQVDEVAGYIFIVDYPSSGTGISFFIYQKGANDNKKVFATAYTIK